MNFHIIIPARFGSSRLAGKVLLDVQGKPLIQHVYERAITCGAASVAIATDDERVLSVAKGFGATVYMTDNKHECGTDRLAEVVRQYDMAEDEIIVNLQGDEALVSPSAVRKTVQAMIDNPSAAMTTLCTPITEYEEIFDPNVVKVVVNKNGYALNFSRAPIPWNRKEFSFSNIEHKISKSAAPNVNLTGYNRHVGLYAYRARTLKLYAEWEKSPLEDIELLEMLRVLWHGEKIHVSMIDEVLPPGVDTEADLHRLRAFFEKV